MLGHGGITFIQQASGISRVTITKGIEELEASVSLPAGKDRAAGGGRKKLEQNDKTLKQDLDDLVADTTRGDPESPLLWTLKSTRTLANELAKKEHEISHTSVGKLLKEADYTLQSNKKSKEGSDHPDRDEQFQHINSLSKEYLEASDPVISVDAKKKELVGNYKNPGQRWLPKGKPIEVKMHDFPDKEQGKAVPYGIYDLAADHGYVNVGINHNTAQFAVESIRRWWQHLGQNLYPKAQRLLINADSGGSNGYRLRLWKSELQKLANETGLTISVSHFPPGTSKWNKIEHRLFSFITINWKGKPLSSYQVIVKLIASTKTKTGLKVFATLDDNIYKLRKKISNQELKALNITPHQFHGDWNYSICPQF